MVLTSPKHGKPRRGRVQTWVNDTTSPEFIREARRQARLLRDSPDPELDAWSEEVIKASWNALDDDEAR